MYKDILYPLRRMHGILHEKKLKLQYKASFEFPLGKKVFLVGTPLHGNIGDSAIVIAQIEFLHRTGYDYDRIKEITFKDYYENRRLFKRVIKRKNLICLHGGGNIGSQWPMEDQLRYDVIKDFPANRMVMFPQTAFFYDDPDGRNRMNETITYYNNENLTLAAREQNTYHLMQGIYPDSRVLLTPDIVLSTTAQTYGVKVQHRTEEILFCFRNDTEKALSDKDVLKLKAFVDEKKYVYRDTDTHLGNEKNVTVSERKDAVKRKISEFAKAKLILTDRLHGMVFAAITATPCIVFDNNNHKVQGTYEWIKYLPYIKYVQNEAAAEKAFSELISINTETFNNQPLLKYFDSLSEAIQT